MSKSTTHVVLSGEPLFDENQTSIFLAGPTRRFLKDNPEIKAGYENSWRREAVEILDEITFNGIVYIPEFHENDNQFDGSWEAEKKQIDWEWEALKRATRIVFWIPRDIEGGMPAFTTNVEFGRYMEMCPYKCVLGYPDTAERMSYLKYLYESLQPHTPIFNTLRDVITYTARSIDKPF